MILDLRHSVAQNAQIAVCHPRLLHDELVPFTDLSTTYLLLFIYIDLPQVTLINAYILILLPSTFFLFFFPRLEKLTAVYHLNVAHFS